MLDYHFPGNIRELRNIVEYCANVCRCTTIDRSDLPGYLLDRAGGGAAAVSPAVAKRDEPPVPGGSAPAGTRAGGDNWAAIEREMILEALKTARGNRSKAAGMLGWGRTTLWRKMIQHGLA